MLGRRRVFAVAPLGGRDQAAEDLARGCVVPGITSTYRRIPDTAPGCSPPDPWRRDGKLRGFRRQARLLKLASQDSGVEMAVGDSPPATSPGPSQEPLDFEPVVSPEPLALPTEPPAHLGRLLASRKLEQVLERSRLLPTSPASLSQHHRSPRPPGKPECEMPLFGAGDQEALKAEAEAAELEEAEVVRGLEPEAWACLPGQGLRYLEHLCLVLEQMARLQQLHLQLQTQRPLGDAVEEEESESAPAPSHPSSHAPGSEVHRPWELLSQTEETGAKRASLPKVGLPSANPPRLSEAPAEPAHAFQSSQGHKRDLSHWNKVKILLNRIRWKSPRHPEPPAPPDGPAPWIESRDLPERSPCRPLQKAFMPALVVKKQRAKNLSVR
ncbi:uncharacterized protein C8orf58 homolog isoform X2 [Rousettus aegyptiacus]|uniref:DUF4657 domain-containing protein n=1 Tax=Rousettus aegyptiacus TaxID=9407 RepID=A0A7J8BPQ8_ROUAE|nr:uncharacterized protein C8orf58 homolog isoform X2 [Rousettus aegyptiacus]KAF6400509.1 hypothetical protein HJG63_001927 [Rousettus aegyptiacus]